MPQAQTERNRHIYALTQIGRRYEDIGQQFGISMQRVHEIAVREAARALEAAAISAEAQRPFAARRVARLPLSVTVRRVLAAAGIHTVGALITYDRDELLRLEGFGPGALAEVNAYLAIQWAHAKTGQAQRGAASDGSPR
jgi:DNA-directed RNA polymerase alpha subunit